MHKYVYIYICICMHTWSFVSKRLGESSKSAAGNSHLEKSLMKISMAFPIKTLMKTP